MPDNFEYPNLTFLNLKSQTWAGKTNEGKYDSAKNR